MDAEVSMDVEVTDGVPEVMQAAAEVEGDEFTLETVSGQEVMISVGQVTSNVRIDENAIEEKFDQADLKGFHEVMFDHGFGDAASAVIFDRSPSEGQVMTALDFCEETAEIRARVGDFEEAEEWKQLFQAIASTNGVEKSFEMSI